MGVTYLIVDEYEDRIVAYYTLFNDKITRAEVERTIWNRMSRNLPNEKRRNHYPAVKIGRLAVNKNYANHGIGSTQIGFNTTIIMAEELSNYFVFRTSFW